MDLWPKIFEERRSLMLHCNTSPSLSRLPLAYFVWLSLVFSKGITTVSHFMLHIVVFLADDLGYNDISWHNPHVLTPHFQDLADGGVILEQHAAKINHWHRYYLTQLNKYVHRYYLALKIELLLFLVSRQNRKHLNSNRTRYNHW